MVKETMVEINPRRILSYRDFNIYGHFIEHFHRQIYGGIFQPESPFSDEQGFRTDVIDALKNIRTPILRWPGGCFVSNYHWEDGVGTRTPFFDKAWRVEEPNTFGTDEYIEFCRKIQAQPYICTNAGTGTAEEMSNWVEYCNLKNEGKYAKMRIENGNRDPFNVKYWSIGNENYGSWEIGAKEKTEWGRLVVESAKMMKRVDPKIELLAASISDLDWNINLLKEAGQFLDWISIHGYWDALHEVDEPSSYESCMVYTMKIEEQILKTKYILGSLGYLNKIKIAFDEWNLRGWHHPNVHRGDILADNIIEARDRNDLNATYTMADAIFNACFLNLCLKHSDIVGMANFAPIVNTRGAVFTHDEGILLRSTYFVFELYTKHMGDTVVDSWVSEADVFEVSHNGSTYQVPSLDMIATTNTGSNDLRISIVNRHPEQARTVRIKKNVSYGTGTIYSLISASKDGFNDISQLDCKIIQETVAAHESNDLVLEVQPHSVNVLVLH
ncbi:alpha-L-arabinofuranosidase C-terminal domain-containing protein [Litchfieldia alkalitelluris]|uniref:alpha-L-arabinofuranosidase C-terminal domain-containing protein n=1 Tax=Litchfieldia alkalitelluris TaxID=304268 RepID=UPI000996BE55|nr:alpha-L-arabinofuranosidase C-terminal domain-containing protein [Litchfieldia alkalitelluris]